MSDNDGTILGGLSEAYDAAADALDAAGEAAYDIGAATYHHTAGTVDYFVNDHEGAAEHEQARQEYVADCSEQFERIYDNVGVDGLSEAYDSATEIVDAAGDATYDIGAAVYHKAAGTVDYFVNDHEGAAEHEQARQEYNADRSEQFDRIGEELGY
jgi:hypothetical protein